MDKKKTDIFTDQLGNNTFKGTKPAMQRWIPVEDWQNQKRLRKQKQIEIKANLALKCGLKGKRQHMCFQLRQARVKKGLSQMELSIKIGCDQNYISKVETGKINVSMDMFLRIAHHLDCWIIVQEKREEREV